jgi:epoxyqueuosine reductase
VVETEALKQEALRLGFDIVGVCPVVSPPHIDAYREWLESGFAGEMNYLHRHLELKSDPGNLLEGARSIVAVGLNYNQPRPSEPGMPIVSKYALGRDYHRVLRGKLTRLARWIETENPGSKSRACVDSAPIMERDFAQLAGLGWFGKNTMLINSQRGSWFFIGLLLTTVEFRQDRPALGGCGTCTQCIDACPTGAIVNVGGRWSVDARRCVSYLTIEYGGDISSELERGIGGWTVGCDVCQDVCPFNNPRESQPLRASATDEPDFAIRKWPSLVELAELSEESWDQLTRGSATRRIPRDQLIRNAKANLQNKRRSSE